MAEWSKAIDLKSIILWMRRFKSCHCRFLKFFFPTYIYIIITGELYHREKEKKHKHRRQRGRVVKAVAC